MTVSDLSGTTAPVTGATRGFGRSITVALHEAGAEVVAVTRDAGRLAELRSELGPPITTVTADATDPDIAGGLLSQPGLDLDVFVKQMGPTLTPEFVGDQFVQLVSSNEEASGAYLLTPEGRKEISP